MRPGTAFTDGKVFAISEDLFTVLASAAANLFTAPGSEESLRLSLKTVSGNGENGGGEEAVCSIYGLAGTLALPRIGTSGSHARPTSGSGLFGFLEPTRFLRLA